MQLYLVRHPAPLAPPGACYGRSDLAVAPDVMAHAVERLRTNFPCHLPVFSSPLQRCAVLANALFDDVMFDARLAEIDFGAWEMRHWDDIARAEVDAWAADVVHYRPGGGESVHDMALRVSAFYDTLELAGTGAAIVICHAGTMRLLAARHRGLAPEAMARTAAAAPHAIAYGEILILPGV